MTFPVLTARFLASYCTVCFFLVIIVSHCWRYGEFYGNFVLLWQQMSKYADLPATCIVQLLELTAPPTRPARPR